jgi:nitroreductase
MEFRDVITARVSVRGYSEKSVEDEKLTYILDCARRAPSWANKQPWRFVVVRDKEMITRLTKHSLINPWLKTAPVVIVACADPSDSGSRNGLQFYGVDVAIAVEHLMLAAADVGLGTCWIGGFDEEKIKAELQIPRRIRIVAITPLGYPAEKKNLVGSTARLISRGDRRKSLAEIVHIGHW